MKKLTLPVCLYVCGCSVLTTWLPLLAQPQIGPNVPVSLQSRDQTEPAVAADPNDPDHLIAAAMHPATGRCMFFESLDAGSTWEGDFITLPPTFTSCSDPSVAFGSNSEMYLGAFVEKGTRGTSQHVSELMIHLMKSLPFNGEPSFLKSKIFLGGGRLFWSRTEWKFSPSVAWAFSFFNGERRILEKTELAHAWGVRDLQPGDTFIGRDFRLEFEKKRVLILFAHLVSQGTTSVKPSSKNPLPDDRLKFLGDFYLIETTAKIAAGSSITVCLSYKEIDLPSSIKETSLRLAQLSDGGAWKVLDPDKGFPDTTTKQICSPVRTFSWFTVVLTLSTPFKRGDVDGNGNLEITDAINQLLFQFLGQFTPPCMDALDFDDNGEIEISDPISNLTFQFLGGVPVKDPFSTCGTDPSDDQLDCDQFKACQ